MYDESLKIAIKEAVLATLTELRSMYPDENFYCFALFTSPDVTYILPTASGETGLAKMARDYAGKEDAEQIEKEMEVLRWSPADSPYHLLGEEHFTAVQELLDSRPEPYSVDQDVFTGGDNEVAVRFDACFGALMELDAQGVFGTGADRERIIVNVLQGDQSDRSRLENAKKIGNPSSALEHFASELNIRESVGKLRYLGTDQVYQMNDLTVSEDLMTVAVCGSGGELYAFSWPSGKQLLASAGRGGYWALGISGKGNLLVVSNQEKLCRYTLPSGDTIGEFVAHEKQVCAVAVSPDGTQIISAGRDNSIIAWNAESLKQQWRVEFFAKALRYASDGKRIVAGGSGVWILDSIDGSIITQLVKPNKKKPWYVYSVAWSHDGYLVAVAAENEPGTIRIFDVGKKTEMITFFPKDRGTSTVDFSRDGRYLASAHVDGHIHIWNINNGECVETLQGRHESMCGGCRWLDNQHIAATGRDVDLSPPVCVFDVSI